MSEPRRRLFFALWPAPATRAALAGAAAAVHLGRARRVHPDNLHLTLVFVGPLEATAARDCAAAGARVEGRAFELEIGTLGHFARARVAWLGPLAEPPALGALVAALRAQLAAADLPFDPKPFRAHVTIGREVRQLEGGPALSPVRWPVTEFALVESVSGADGARYEVRGRWPLRPGGRDETAQPPVR